MKTNSMFSHSGMTNVELLGARPSVATGACGKPLPEISADRGLQGMSGVAVAGWGDEWSVQVGLAQRCRVGEMGEERGWGALQRERRLELG